MVNMEHGGFPYRLQSNGATLDISESLSESSSDIDIETLPQIPATVTTDDVIMSEMPGPSDESGSDEQSLASLEGSPRSQIQVDHHTEAVVCVNDDESADTSDKEDPSSTIQTSHVTFQSEPAIIASDDEFASLGYNNPGMWKSDGTPRSVEEYCLMMGLPLPVHQPCAGECPAQTDSCSPPTPSPPSSPGPPGPESPQQPSSSSSSEPTQSVHGCDDCVHAGYCNSCGRELFAHYVLMLNPGV